MDEQQSTMEKLGMKNLFGGIYQGKRVLITGHTGFKGSWLSLWLNQMGAEIFGLALDPPTLPNHYNLLDLNIKSYIQDITNLIKVKEILDKVNPEIIFHFAAQPLVRLSYKEPVSTYMTNIMGTVNILEASRTLSNLKAIIIVTSDKCYENKEWIWGYRENESMGGVDPYSSSKGCAELITAAYRNSYFNSPGKSALIASVRAGNVIGGGDWATDRIITDIITSISNSSSVYLRNPGSTRPWQYVLEPLSGYLTLGWNLLLGKDELAGAWNFGPSLENNVTVLDLVKEAKKSWEKISFDFDKGNHPHEASFLMLDSSKAFKTLQWQPVWDFRKTVANTICWYKDYYESNILLSESILKEFINDARKKGIIWS